jgi:hypothetical protein
MNEKKEEITLNNPLTTLSNVESTKTKEEFHESGESGNI